MVDNLGIGKAICYFFKGWHIPFLNNHLNSPNFAGAKAMPNCKNPFPLF